MAQQERKFAQSASGDLKRLCVGREGERKEVTKGSFMHSALLPTELNRRLLAGFNLNCTGQRGTRLNEAVTKHMREEL